MNIPLSTYYYKSKKSAKKIAEESKLKKRIEEIVKEFPGYGERRVTKQLHREGYRVNHKRIGRLMVELDIQCKQPRAYRPTTNSKHNFQRYPNLIIGITPTAPNQIWVADITYIHLAHGFVYLSAILDLFSRKVIGYALSLSLDASLATEALKMALRDRKPLTGCIHHSDQGVQYASEEYVNILKEHNILSSMSDKGNPYHNATAESFFKTFKYEEVYLNDYQTIDDVIERVPYFLEQVYNAKRLHSSLGYVPPNEFEVSYKNNFSALSA
ncbi:MAG: transposase [Elusimicrobia bacterium RIFOXYA2_FULL_39_19]|nr:MAG: transposase [Elusimicrobia bacterium RIFOXYA2_FULL_39_19]